MIFHRKVGVAAAARGRRYSGAKAAIIFLFWILLILAQLGLLIAFGHEETGKLVKSLPRKARFFETRFHAPPSQDQPLDIGKGDPDTVYEDDKRIIHTDLRVHTREKRALALAFSVMFNEVGTVVQQWCVRMRATEKASVNAPLALTNSKDSVEARETKIYFRLRHSSANLCLMRISSHEGLIYSILNYVGAKQLANKAKESMHEGMDFWDARKIYGLHKSILSRRDEDFDGKGKWRNGSSVLVERFELKRINGSSVLTFDSILGILVKLGEMRMINESKSIPARFLFLLVSSITSLIHMAAMCDVLATETAIIYGLEPVWGSGFTWFLLGERMGAASVLGKMFCPWLLFVVSFYLLIAILKRGSGYA
ncbi:hypothetical protein POTOM_031738 [Populus tomentosa]|uniref:Uncharacterized protein n=1 Tax=Populus tomentosa TaxID=118781 RepID=A0A8X7ZJ37_POPTO|nr:hypothetical protein POTOM_031738 [Populus tomentosa]